MQPFAVIWLPHTCSSPPHAAQRYSALFALRNKGGVEAVRALGDAFTHCSSALLKHEVAYVMGQMQVRGLADTDDANNWIGLICLWLRITAALGVSGVSVGSAVFAMVHPKNQWAAARVAGGMRRDRASWFGVAFGQAHALFFFESCCAEQDV